MKKWLSVVGIIAIFAIIGAVIVACGGDDDKKSSLTAEEQAAKADTLEGYAEEPEMFEAYIEKVREMGADVPKNNDPNKWSDSDWKKWFAYEAENEDDDEEWDDEDKEDMEESIRASSLYQKYRR